MQAIQSRAPVPLIVIAGAGAFTLVVGKLVESQQGVRLALTAVLALLFVAIGLLSPKHLIFTLAVWLGTLGLVRRVVEGAAPGNPDPLLLVAPATLIFLAVFAAGHSKGLPKTSLTYCVLILQLAAVLSIFNPLQGGIAVGMAGLLLIPVPTLAFWVGRGLADDRTVGQVLKLVGVLAVPAAAYGLYQALHEFPSWDRAWISEFGYTSLNVGGVIRPFSSFSSATDFNTFLGIGMIAWLLLLARRRPLTSLAVLPLIFVALLYGSQRLIVATGIGAAGLALAAWRRWPMGGALLAALALLVAAPFALSHLRPQLDPIQSTSPLLEHQIQGIIDPLGEQSTLMLRTNMVLQGVNSIRTNPLGLGIGAPTIAADRFGGSQSSRMATDADPSNISVALGAPGLLLYAILSFIAFRQAYKLAVTRRDWLGYAVLAVLGITVTQWLTGGQYAVAWLPWLLLGWVDRSTASPPGLPEPDPAEARQAVTGQ